MATATKGETALRIMREQGTGRIFKAFEAGASSKDILAVLNTLKDVVQDNKIFYEA